MVGGRLKYESLPRAAKTFQLPNRGEQLFGKGRIHVGEHLGEGRIVPDLVAVGVETFRELLSYLPVISHDCPQVAPGWSNSLLLAVAGGSPFQSTDPVQSCHRGAVSQDA